MSFKFSLNFLTDTYVIFKKLSTTPSSHYPFHFIPIFNGHTLQILNKRSRKARISAQRKKGTAEVKYMHIRQYDVQLLMPWKHQQHFSYLNRSHEVPCLPSTSHRFVPRIRPVWTLFLFLEGHAAEVSIKAPDHSRSS